MAGVLLLAASPGLAWCHATSDAFLNWRVDGDRIEQRVEVPLRDLDRDLGLDADGDGQLRWGEVRARWPQIQQLVDQGLRVLADGQPCRAVAPAEPQLETHDDSRYALLVQTLQCPGRVRRLHVDYRLFAGTDAGHRGLARLDGEARPVAVLVPGGDGHDWTLEDRDARPGFGGFVAEGVHHIAVGADHVLFLVTLIMVAVWRREGGRWVPRARAASAWVETLRLVSAFTVAHSLTLGLAVTGVLAPPTRWVETAIALSVLLAALDNIRPFFPGPRWVMVAGFGLAHGFGFAGPLQALGLRQGEVALPLFGFNLGVEIGQLALVAVLLPLASALRHAPVYRLGVVRAGSAAIALLALAWTLERGLDLGLAPATAATAAATATGPGPSGTVPDLGRDPALRPAPPGPTAARPAPATDAGHRRSGATDRNP